MSSLSEIHFNYSRAVRQADQLEGVSHRLSSLAEGNMEYILTEVSRAWRSDSTPHYIQKGQKVKEDIKTTSNNLYKIAKAIREIAERVRDAELEAWRVAHERNS